MLGHYVKSHFHQCVFWGIVLQCLGGLVPLRAGSPILTVLGWSMVIGGTVLMVVGFACYAGTKGRSPAWALLALGSVIGWIILVLLEPKQTSVAASSTTQRKI